jgi:hypothetical protein
MEWVGDLLGNSARNPSATDFPSSRFYCRLDQQPDHLVPEFCLPTQQACSDTLSLNPGCLLTHDRELPSQLLGKELLLENFALQGPLVWIPHPGTGAQQPFWLNEEWHELLGNWRRGGRAPSALSPEARHTLAMAGVLIDSVEVQEQQSRRERATAAASRQFRQRGYAPIAGLIHPFHVAGLRRYYRHRIRTGKMKFGDSQSSRRYVAYNESVARFFHHQLTAAVAAIVGEAVKPSYVYVASYQGGAMLERHTDREQCEFSITLCLDYSPEPSLATGWPLLLHTGSGTVSVYQAIGDGLLYRGRELPHSRDTLRAGQTSTSIFFHYVREDFSGSLN